MSQQEQNVIERLLDSVAQNFGLVLSNTQTDLLICYMDHLARWNRRIRLVGSADPDTLVRVHLADALAVAFQLQQAPPAKSGEEQTLIDVGSGAGLPGLILSLLLPELQVTLCDVSEKKTSFLFEVARALRSSARIVNQPVARLVQENRTFTHCISRAFVGPREWHELGCTLAAPRGFLWFMLTEKQLETYTPPLLAQVTRYSVGDGLARALIKCPVDSNNA